MKKIITFLLVFLASLQFVFADVPNPPPIYYGANIINVYGYPDWIFFIRYDDNYYEKIPDDGNISCFGSKKQGISLVDWEVSEDKSKKNFSVEMWAVENTDEFKNLVEEHKIMIENYKDMKIINKLGVFFTNEDFQNNFIEKGAKQLFKDQEIEMYGCDVRSYEKLDKNYIKINPEDLGLLSNYIPFEAPEFLEDTEDLRPKFSIFGKNTKITMISLVGIILVGFGIYFFRKKPKS